MSVQGRHDDPRHSIPPEIRARLQAELQRHGLASFMNQTKWRELRAAVETGLPFIPAWEAQNILLPPQPVRRGLTAVAGGHGWSYEDMPPFPLVEWVRMIPRIHATVGGPLRPPQVVEDCSDDLRAVLVRLSIPFLEDGEGAFWVYGYAPADPATLTPPLETIS
jgi:hypothetical protein